MGAERRSMVMTEDEKKLTAYHEAGHALCMLYAEGHEPLHKVTIIPRGRALGITMFLPERDKYSQSKLEIKAMMASLFGGRVAEELIFGPDKVTTGAADDIRRATGSGAPHGHRVRVQRKARAAALRRERGRGLPRPLGHPAQERLRGDRQGHRRGDPPHRRRRRADRAGHPDRASRRTALRWRRACSNTRPCRPTRSAGSSRASGSSRDTSTGPAPRKRAREGAARCRPPAGRPVSSRSRSPAAERPTSRSAAYVNIALSSAVKLSCYQTLLRVHSAARRRYGVDVENRRFTSQGIFRALTVGSNFATIWRGRAWRGNSSGPMGSAGPPTASR